MEENKEIDQIEETKKKREILFRGKQIENSNWAVGSLLIDKHDNYYIGANINFNTKQEYYRATRNTGKIINRFIGIGFCVVDPQTVGQFTGLHDKNGKEIFEGDIIHVKEFNFEGTKVNDHNYQIEYKHGYFAATKKGQGRVSIFNGVMWSTDGEVIGNIHDNPELLEVK